MIYTNNYSYYKLIVLMWLLLSLPTSMMAWDDTEYGANVTNEKRDQNTPSGWTAVSLPSITIKGEYNITSYGASTSSEDNSTAINDAITAANSAGGGIVIIPAGTWMVANPIDMKSNVVLHLSANCTLKMQPKGTYPAGKENYLISNRTESSTSNIIIEGEGETSVIDGNGADWWPNYKSTATADIRPGSIIRIKKGSNHVYRNFKITMAPQTNLTIGQSGNVNNVTVHDIIIKNPAAESDLATADGYSTISHNTDGMPVWANHVNIYNCDINTGDDNIVCDDGANYVHAWNIKAGRGHGMSVGSNTKRVHDIIYENITFNGTTSGFRIKSDATKSGNDQSGTSTNGAVKNIICRNATMTAVRNPIKITSWYDADAEDASTVSTPSTITETTPEFCNILFQNITADATSQTSWKHGAPVYIYGRPELKIHDITLDNVTVKSKVKMYLAYCENVTFKNKCNIQTNNATTSPYTYEASYSGNYDGTANATYDDAGTSPVYFNVGDYTYYTTTVLNGQTVSKPSTDPTMTGKTFKGWATSKTSTTTVTFPYTITAATTFYAVWEGESGESGSGESGSGESSSTGTNISLRFASTDEASSITSNTTYCTNFTVGASSSKSVSVASSSKTIDEVSFSYCLKLGGTGSSEGRYISFPVSGDCAIKVYGASASSSTTRSLTIASGSFALGTSLKTDFCSSSSDPVAETYNYTGDATTIYIYSTNSGYNIYGIDVTYSSSGSSTPSTYTVSYNLMGHGDAIADVTETTTLPAELPTPTADGYAFWGWFTDEACTAKAEANATITNNTTLYAKWTDASTTSGAWSIDFATIGDNESLADKAGVVISSTVATIGGTPMGAVKMGNTYLNPNFVMQTGTSWIYRTAQKAIYSFNSSNRSFGMRGLKVGQTISMKITDCTSITPTNATANTGSPENNVYTFTVTADGDVAFSINRYSYIYSITVSAVPTYTVRFMNGSNTFDTQSIELNATVSAPSGTPVKDGYTFSHWSETEGGSAATFPYTITAAKDFYAVFTENQQEVETPHTTSYDAYTKHSSSIDASACPSDNLDGIKITYGSSAWTVDGGEGKGITCGDDTYTGCVTASSNGSYSSSNSTVTSGAITLEPEYDGTIVLAAIVNSDKAFYVVDETDKKLITSLPAVCYTSGCDGKTLYYKAADYKYYEENTYSTKHKLYGTVTFSVEAGHKYSLGVSGSKMGLYGFSYQYNTTSSGGGSTDPDPETPTNPAAGTACTFDASTRYSKLVMDSRLNDYYANTTKVGFGVFSADGTQTSEPTYKTTKVNNVSNTKVLDYVPGLVAKAVLEAVDYYKDGHEASIDVMPWYHAIKNYGKVCVLTDNGTAGKSFDDLNAVKLYFKLKELAGTSNSSFTDAEAVTTANARLASTLTAFGTANTSYAITSDTNTKAAGGWWHKSSYDNQMWCDGQYMGPALLAQMINDYSSYSKVANSGTDWDLITKQINISWNYLWNSDTKLLYHAFSATPSANTSSCWATLACPYDNTCSTNAAYWGRADGWYMFALVDILEQMDRAGISKTDANYSSIRTKLNTLASGIAARQDATSGCWYQLLDKDASYSSNGTSNYLESSATAIFTAAFLKGQRLGYFDANYYPVAQKAYKGMVNNFMVADGNGGIHLINCCRSAGLGGSNNRKGDYDYYLNGSDVNKTTDVTEGKVLGAFIMAATEYERMFIDGPATVTAKVADTRTFGSFSSIYNVDFSDARNTDIIAAYTVKFNSGSKTVTLTRHKNVLPAGTGVVLYAPTATKSQAFATVAEANATVAENDLIGVPVATYVPVNVEKNSTTYYNYVVNSNAFHPLSEGGTIAAGKAYLSIPYNSAATGNSKSISMSFYDDVATGISNAQEGFSIFGNGKIYNLQGVEIKTPERGKIYIVNGRKFIMQ